MISVCFQGKPFNITVIQVYTPTGNVEEVEWFYEGLQDLLELTPDWNAKVGSQEITAVTGKFVHLVQNEAGQRLKEFCQENALVIQQHKRRFYMWTSLDNQFQIQIDNILYSRRWRSYTQSAKTRPGADCGSDQELM